MRRRSTRTRKKAKVHVGVEEGSYSLFGKFVLVTYIDLIYTYTILCGLVFEILNATQIVNAD